MASQVLIHIQAFQDETVLKDNCQICYLWAAVDVDTNEVLAVYASRGRGIPSSTTT